MRIGDGLRESAASWLERLRDLKVRGLEDGPVLAVGDGALGLWAAPNPICPETRPQRCRGTQERQYAQRTAQERAGPGQGGVARIWMALTRAQAVVAFDAFLRSGQAKYPKATDKLVKDREALLAFYDFPAEHWLHLRTTHPVESAWATVCQRTTRTKNCLSRATFLGLAFKDGGVPAPDNLPERQQMAA